MKYIKLHNTFYFSKHGITLNLDNPYVEATEENILKLNKFIEEKYLKVVELDEDGKEIIQSFEELFGEEKIEPVAEEKIETKEIEEPIEELTEEIETEEPKKEKKSKKAK